MKLSTICSICAAFAAALMLAGCGGGPDDVAIDFMKKVAKGDVGKASALASKDVKPLIALAVAAMDEDEKAEMKDASFKVLSTDIDGDEATVELQITDKDGGTATQEIDLVKEGGNWKVTFITMKFGEQDEQAKIATTRTSILNIKTAVNTYEIMMGRYPNSLEDLTVGTDSQPALLEKRAINDSWGNPFDFKKTGKYGFKITSPGPDGQLGTEDDITN